MRMVNVRVDAEEALEHVFYYLLKVLRERNANLGREDGLIIKLALDPRHQVVNVLWRGDLDRLLELNTVRPQVLVPSAAAC